MSPKFCPLSFCPSARSLGMDYQGGGGGGGFGGGTPMGGGTPPTSSGGRSYEGSSARRSADEQTLHPITVGQCLSSQPDESGGTQLEDGRRANRVKIVAAVRSFQDYSTNCLYEMEDGTGLIDVKQWIGTEDCASLVRMRELCNKEHIYLAIVGSIKDYDDKKTILADSIRPISTGNEISHHFLEVVYSAEKPKRQNVYGQQQHHTGGQSSMNPGNAVVFGGAPIQQQQQQGNQLKDAVLDFIKKEGDFFESGANIVSCIGRLQNSLHTEHDIRKAVESLAAEGHIYTTIDENWYKFAF